MAPITILSAELPERESMVTPSDSETLPVTHHNFVIPTEDAEQTSLLASLADVTRFGTVATIACAAFVAFLTRIGVCTKGGEFVLAYPHPRIFKVGRSPQDSDREKTSSKRTKTGERMRSRDLPPWIKKPSRFTSVKGNTPLVRRAH